MTPGVIKVDLIFFLSPIEKTQLTEQNNYILFMVALLGKDLKYLLK